MNERRPVWYALAVAIVLLTAAVSYRIVKTDGDIDVQGNKDGIQVKITQAQQTIDSAQHELSELSKQLDQRQAAIEKAELELTTRQAKVAELLASLEPSTPSGNRPRTIVQLRAAEEQLKTLRSAPPLATVAAPAPEAVKARVTKINELQQKLSKTSADLKAVQRP